MLTLVGSVAAVLLSVPAATAAAAHDDTYTLILILLGALTLVSAIVVPWRQWVLQRRDRDNERRTEQWRADREEIGETIARCEDLAIWLHRDGPFTGTELDAHNVETICVTCARLARHGKGQLYGLLSEISDKLDALKSYAISDKCAPIPADLRSAALQERTASALEALTADARREL
jgi:hypothetical protein